MAPEPSRAPPAASLAAVARARVARERAARGFEDALRAAYAEGHSLRAIAREAGLTHGRVSQIVGRRKDA